MPDYTVVVTKRVQKQLDRLSDKIATPILKAIGELGQNPRPSGCKKLKGRSGYRIRVGNYRIIYEIIDKQLLITIITVGDRKEVYE